MIDAFFLVLIIIFLMIGLLLATEGFLFKTKIGRKIDRKIRVLLGDDEN